MKRNFCILSIFLLIFIFSSCTKNPPETNKELKIRFTPRGNCNSEITFIDDLDYYMTCLLVEQIEKARKVSSIGIGFIPKEKTGEGEYELMIYEKNACIGTYSILNTDYTFDNQRDCYLKTPGLLNLVRAEFYLRLLEKES